MTGSLTQSEGMLIAVAGEIEHCLFKGLKLTQKNSEPLNHQNEENWKLSQCWEPENASSWTCQPIILIGAKIWVLIRVNCGKVTRPLRYSGGGYVRALPQNAKGQVILELWNTMGVHNTQW
jgi:hypothetical protein